MIRWYANLSLTTVAVHALFAGLVASAAGYHWGLLLAVVPIGGWAGARWWLRR